MCLPQLKEEEKGNNKEKRKEKKESKTLPPEFHKKTAHALSFQTLSALPSLRPPLNSLRFPPSPPPRALCPPPLSSHHFVYFILAANETAKHTHNNRRPYGRVTAEGRGAIAIKTATLTQADKSRVLSTTPKRPKKRSMRNRAKKKAKHGGGNYRRHSVRSSIRSPVRSCSCVLVRVPSRFHYPFPPAF